MRSRLLQVLSLGVVLSLAGPALAADPPDHAAVEEGRERFRRGVALFRDGDFRAALVEFRRANEIAPSYKIQFNIAQTCLELQDYACALRAFESYLGEGDKEVPMDRRRLSEREVERLRTLVGFVRVSSNTDDAEVSVDDVPVGRTPLAEASLVSAGRHRITVSRSPLTPVTRVVDVAGGDRLDVTIDLEVQPSPLRSATPPEEPGGLEPRGPAQSEPRETVATASPSRAPFWIGLVSTGALAAGTAVSGGLAMSAKSDLDGTVARFGVAPDEVASAQSSVRTLSTVTDVLLISTLVAAGVTTVLFFTTGSPPRATPSATTSARWLSGPLSPLGM